MAGQVREAKEFETLVTFVWANVWKSNSGSIFAWRVVKLQLVAMRLLEFMKNGVATRWHGIPVARPAGGIALQERWQKLLLLCFSSPLQFVRECQSATRKSVH